MAFFDISYTPIVRIPLYILVSPLDLVPQGWGLCFIHYIPMVPSSESGT